MENKVLFVAPHPDDETLGCGGTILKHKSQGNKIYWLIITNISVENGWPVEKVAERQKEIDTVAEKYGFDKVFKLDLPTTKLDILPAGEIIGKVSDIINKTEPDIVYINNRSDIHTDHHVVFQSVMSCSKSFRYPSVKKILMYETLSETEFAPALTESSFIPNTFSDISAFFDMKTEIMKTYKSEIMPENLPRSFSAIEALAKYRGSRIGCKYAEAFQLILEIN